MTKKTQYVGRHVNGTKSSDKWLAPKNPQTGDGSTRRRIFDGIRLVFKKES